VEADCFANVEDHASNYDPVVPIYGQTDPYSTSTFFHSMQSSRGPYGIRHDWVLGQTVTTDLTSEQTNLSNFSGFADDFHHFAQLFNTDYPNGLVDVGRNRFNLIILGSISDTAQYTSPTNAVVSLPANSFIVNIYNQLAKRTDGRHVLRSRP
jgi:hypothetical protein